MLSRRPLLFSFLFSSTLSGLPLAIVLSLSGCAPGEPMGLEPPPEGFSLLPGSITIAPGGTSQFAVTVTSRDRSSTTPAVSYSATGGTITSGGLYTAGTSPGTFQVIATKQDGSVADTSTVTVSSSPPTLRSLATARHFTIGAAVDMGAYRTDLEFRQKLLAEYNNVVPENAMKFAYIHPGPTQYAFADADELVAFALANGMAIHGHTLVWHNSLPTWITAGAFTKEQLLAVLKAHIEIVVSRYRGKVSTWDVVNEVVNNDGSLRNTIWLRVVGPEYIDSAFVWANRADPAARLYLNDFDAEWMTPKSDSILSLVERLRQKQIPIHGVGFQAHFTTTPPAIASIRANLTRFTNAGFDIRVSEMDVRIADGAGESELAQQANVYHDMLDACLALTRCVGLTTWGFTDRYSWITNPATRFSGFGRALPFDASYQPKPAYDALLARLEVP